MIHKYEVHCKWIGNTGAGTGAYNAYKRDHELMVDGKVIIPASSDPKFRGDKSRYNPEELLVASLSSCHMLWYLHLCADEKIIVTAYEDHAYGEMIEDENGGRFTSVILKPVITLQDRAMTEKAQQLHEVANKKCFIANSVNFPVHHQPVFNYV